jgi:hypothetical protein
VAAHWRLLVYALHCREDQPGVHVGCVEVAGLTLYHSLVLSEGGIRVPQLVLVRMYLLLRSLQTDTQLHHHVLVLYRLHPRNIHLHLETLNLSFL